MCLASEYRRQFAWRDWSTAFAALPALRGKTVLDLGCAVGDQAVELVARGARVIGFDGNEELLAAARARGLAGAEFRSGDLRALPDLGAIADGLWGSFTPAYFVDLPSVLTTWARLLRPGGWIALTEVDDLFAHEPLEDRAKQHLEAYAAEACAAKRYDFRMGRKLRAHLEGAGWSVVRELALADQEFAFAGPARADVLAAWDERFERMPTLRERCGPDFERVRRAFLECLAHAEHRSRARVVFCLATRRVSGPVRVL